MKFRDPWIDPRILQVDPEVVRAYLLSKGWEYLGPAKVPDMLMFDTREPRGDKPNVLLPLTLEQPHLVQRMIDLFTEVALYEDRYAGDLLNEILQLQAAGKAAPADGSNLPLKARPARK
jgi:hypothetical protein